MCGIAGYIGFESVPNEAIDRTIDRMKRRGPDSQSFRKIDVPEGRQVVLIHSRLSIIDLDPRSDQPYRFEHLSMVFNGEIYNYPEVRKELVDEGYGFTTESDTEVLIKAYHRWGKDSFNRLEGMWALAIYDEMGDELILSRDRFAEKPLFYKRTSSGIYFGSEPKFISALSGSKLQVNMNQISRYLVNGYKSLYKTGDTFFQELKEVEFASVLCIDRTFQEHTHAYWKPRVQVDTSMTLDDAIQGVRERLIQSVKIRLRADVPLAFCLSGGVDSAALASIAAKEFNYNVHSFSIIDRDERYNELGNIQATIDDIGCKHTLIHLEPVNMLERLEKLVGYHDGPVATISYLVHSMLSEQIAANGYRVAISGTAADELLTGYYDHFNLQLYELRNHPDFDARLTDWNQHVQPIVRNPYLRRPKLYLEDASIRDHVYLNQRDFEAFLRTDFHEPFSEVHYSDNLLQSRMLNELFHEGSRVILHEDDLNSMFYSIENRSPYLDSALFDFSYSIPTNHLIRDGFGKYVLRQAVKGYLNDQVRLDRKKKGFNAAITSIVDFANPNDRARLLDDSPIYDLVDRQRMENLMNQENFLNSYSKFIFYFIASKIFLEQHA